MRYSLFATNLGQMCQIAEGHEFNDSSLKPMVAQITVGAVVMVTPPPNPFTLRNSLN